MASVAALPTIAAVATAPMGVDAKPVTAPAFQAPPTPPLSDDERETTAKSEPAVVHGSSDANSSSSPLTFQRRMGDTELSYYLPSRADGVNDMYLHLGFRAPLRLFTPSRVRTAWALFRIQHPPLAARVLFRAWEYTDVRFAYTAPPSVEAALAQAGATLDFRADEGKDALLERYLNGPRMLSNEKLACLVLSTHSVASSAKSAPPPTPNPVNGCPNGFAGATALSAAAEGNVEAEEEEEEIREFDLLICAAHFLGDGMALHRFANEFFTLLAGPDEATGSARSDDALAELLRREWDARWGADAVVPRRNVLPPALEDGLPVETSRFKLAAGKVDFQLDQERQIGGHAFPKRKSPTRHTVVPTVPFDTKKTKAILKRCKENSVSIANALFALSDVAWIRVKEQEEESKRGRELPLMMYSALNLRPYLLPAANAPDNSYWFVAVGYFNVVLPSFLPLSSPNNNNEEPESTDASNKARMILHKTFWHRARVAKKQSTLAGKHPMLVSRTREMALLRGKRARTWAKEDDEKDAGIWVPPTPVRKQAAVATMPLTPPSSSEVNDAPWKLPPAPSSALVGLSLLGNLDGMYKHANYPSVALHTLTTGSRQRAGAMLVFGYTFAGRLWLSLGYDENGFDGGMVERWWAEVLKGVDEFLVD